MALLVARLLDDTDPAELVFVASSPSGSDELGHVWTLTTADGQVLLHDVVVAPTDTEDPYATQEFDHPCPTGTDVLSWINPQTDTSLHALVLDADGNAEPAPGNGRPATWAPAADPCAPQPPTHNARHHPNSATSWTGMRPAPHYPKDSGKPWRSTRPSPKSTRYKCDAGSPTPALTPP